MEFKICKMSKIGFHEHNNKNDFENKQKLNISSLEEW